MKKLFDLERLYVNGNYTTERDNSMKCPQDYIVIKDEYNTMKFDCKDSMVSTSEALNSIICTIFGDDCNYDKLNNVIQLINKYLKDITIISTFNSIETYDSETKISHTINSEKIPGRCFHNADGTYSVISVGYDLYKGYTRDKKHIINHELWHFFTNILPAFFYRKNDLEKDKGTYVEVVSDGGIEFIDKNSKKKIIPNGYKFNRYYEEFNETLKDIFATIGIMKYNKEDVIKIFRDFPNNWLLAKTSYGKTIPLTQLAIAAFSNFSFKNYMNNDNYGVVDLNITCNNGQKMKANDFFYGMIFNPFHVEEKFKEVNEKFPNCETNFRVITHFSMYVYAYNENKPGIIKSPENLKKAVKKYCDELSKFMKNKLMLFYKNNSHDETEICDILNDYNNVLKIVSDIYGIDYEPIKYFVNQQNYQTNNKIR